MSLTYLYDAVSWVLLRWHQLFTMLGVPADTGLNWTLSIVFLVVTARLLLFRTVLRQLHYQRRTQLLQPRIAALRVQHDKDKARLQREIAALQRAEGFNPLAALLPLLLQMPVFVGLLHVLRHLAAAASASYQTNHPARLALYGFTKAETLSAAHAKVLGGAPLAGRLLDTTATLSQLGGDIARTRVVIIVVVLLSAVATYLAQRLVIAGQTTEPDATVVRVQRLTRWLIPLSTLASGLFFPLGVLFYWLAGNVWTVSQQAYLNSVHPPARVSTDR